MKKSAILFLLTLCLPALLHAGKQDILWYDSPADEWIKSLPVGNGRLGAMIYGGIQTETIALNESSMWAGEYDPHQEQPFGKKKLQELRRLFFENQLVEGNRIAGKYLTGKAHSFGTHLPIGDLKINFNYPENTQPAEYKRILDMNNAVHTVTYRTGGITYKRECFSSNPDDVLIMKMTADKKGSINATLSLELLREPSEIQTTDDNQLIFSGQALFPKQGTGGVSFEGRIAVKAKGGKTERTSTQIQIKSADELYVYIDVRTNYKNNEYKRVCRETIQKAMAQKYTRLRKKHITDHSNLFSRVSLSLGNDGEWNETPTDKRWEHFKKAPEKDPGFAALFFQFARYLTIASSRENSPLPIALQGFFNDNLACNMCWTSDYHLDINTQQNYWMTNVGNLAECNAPLFSYIKDLAGHGAVTAQKVYGCKGWTAHTVANIWGFTAPSPRMGYGLFPTAGSWLASHLWTQYEYTQDKKFLKEQAYPLLKGNAEFLLDYMTETPDKKYLVTGPSISPENAFLYEGKYLSASMMPTCDRVLAYEILHACLQSTCILGIDKRFQLKLEKALSKLPPIRLNASGGIREWFEDYQEAIPNHRHTSHLLALYPFSQITPEQTPELAKGALTTINARLSASNWEDVEWSRANMICFFARLKEKQKAYNSVSILLKDFIRENLLSISPKGIAGAPYDIFVFDGNTAGAAGIAEMILQSHEGYIEFLPTLPKQWEEGSFSGLCTRGGAEANAEWRNGAIRTAGITAKVTNEYSIKLPEGKEWKVALNGKETSITPDKDRIITLTMKKGDKLHIY